MKSRKRSKKQTRIKKEHNEGFVSFSLPGGFPSKVVFHDVPTSELVEINDLNSPYPDVKDRFVKVSPRLVASERQTFDGSTISNELRELGARSVVLAPIITSETKKVRSKVSSSQTPRDAVKAWCGEQPVSEEEKKQMIDLIFKFMEAEGV